VSQPKLHAATFEPGETQVYAFLSSYIGGDAGSLNSSAKSKGDSNRTCSSRFSKPSFMMMPYRFAFYQSDFLPHGTGHYMLAGPAGGNQGAVTQPHRLIL
jgi:hypothetical protein